MIHSKHAITLFTLSMGAYISLDACHLSKWQRRSSFEKVMQDTQTFFSWLPRDIQYLVLLQTLKSERYDEEVEIYNRSEKTVKDLIPFVDNPLIRPDLPHALRRSQDVPYHNLFWAIAENNIDEVETLLNNNTQLVNCQYYYHLGVPALAYSANNRALHPLDIAIINQNPAMIRLMTKDKKLTHLKPSNYGPYYYATKLNSVSLTQLLIELGAPIEPYWALSNAVAHENEDLVTLILKYISAPSDAPSPSLWPLLEHAARRGNSRIVKALIDKEADVTKAPCALHNAVLSRSEAIITYLLQDGANINHRDLQGNTPLHIAALNGMHDMIGVLIANGADQTIVNKKNQTYAQLLENKNESLKRTHPGDDDARKRMAKEE